MRHLDLADEDVTLLADLLDVMERTGGAGVIDPRCAGDCKPALDGSLARDLRRAKRVADCEAMDKVTAVFDGWNGDSGAAGGMLLEVIAILKATGRVPLTMF